MELDAGIREMLLALRTAVPDMGLKKLTAVLNDSLPPDIRVEKCDVRDFFRGLDSSKIGQPAATKKDTNEDAATEPGASSTSALRPRDKTFEDVTKQISLAFRNRERHYLMNLSEELYDQMNMTTDGERWAGLPLSHIRHHMQILLTLKGLKPCTLFYVGMPNDGATRTINGIILTHLFPLFQHYDLESYGFKLHYLATEIKRPSGCFGYKGAWVLADLQSGLWPKVRDIFFNSYAEQASISEEDVGLALGYPVTRREEMEQAVMFDDVTERNQFREIYGVPFPYVNVLDFCCSVGDFDEDAAVRRFFRQCQDAAAEIGTKLELNLEYHEHMRGREILMAFASQSEVGQRDVDEPA